VEIKFHLNQISIEIVCKFDWIEFKFNGREVWCKWVNKLLKYVHHFYGVEKENNFEKTQIQKNTFEFHSKQILNWNLFW
jgi:hypothetical protein